MKILVVGGGGREHALCWKLAQSENVSEVICAPGNGGIDTHARCVAVAAEDVDGQVALAKSEQVDLVVVGPEAPLVAGLADRLDEAGIPVFGPSQKAAMLEGSKRFSKEFMERHGIPTARFTSHTDLEEALQEVARRNGPCVVKADGLAAGKGVLLCQTTDEANAAVHSILADKAFGAAGGELVIEDFLKGEEASILAICDGTDFVTLIAAQDHKAAYDGDQGPNTGGMGAYCPAPLVTDALRKKIIDEVIRPSVDGMAKDGTPFKGVLYAGLMIDGERLNVLEFNVRFGDPECQPLLTMLKSDLATVLLRAAKGQLAGTELEWHDGSAVCVVLAAGGYPGSYEKGDVISGLNEAATVPDVMVFHAGTQKDGDNIVTSGGRVLGVTGRGADFGDAREKTYRACDLISWNGMRMRRDIGHRAMK
ncbi:MAG: phosphoribosylamine--glycine ligase [Deltaproteobacteria bacterium]|nr:phosphoribosylamine--glycine ligase [Deltaproteobacteria bacterium]